MSRLRIPQNKLVGSSTLGIPDTNPLLRLSASGTYNNGDTRPGTKYSTIEEIVLPVDANGRYSLGADKKYGPESPVWNYTAPNPADFYSVNISGVQRLPNGNTLICAGAPGIVFEVNPQKKVVWQYNLPAFGSRGGANARNVFRAYRFGTDFAGFKGKTLTAGKTLEEAIR